MKPFWVSDWLIFSPVDQGFYLVDTHRASERILYEALTSARSRPVLLAPKAPWPKGLDLRLPALKKLGITLIHSGKWAVPETWPDVPWLPTASQMEETLKALANVPPLNLEAIVGVLARGFPYPPRADPEPFLDALFRCREPERGPFGGLTAAFYSWQELSSPLGSL